MVDRNWCGRRTSFFESALVVRGERVSVEGEFGERADTCFGEVLAERFEEGNLLRFKASCHQRIFYHDVA